MTLYKIKLVVITLILFIVGCREKDELTRPFRIYLKIGMNDFENEDLRFTGKIGIKSIRFEGKRETGEDFYFQTDPEMNLQTIAFSIDENTLISDFDIPQGIFNYIKPQKPTALTMTGRNKLTTNSGVKTMSFNNLYKQRFDRRKVVRMIGFQT